MKNLKKVFAIMLCLVAVVFLTGCNKEEDSKKLFKEDDFSITLTDNFVKKDVVSQTYYFESTKAIVGVLKEEFTLLSAVNLGKDSTLNDYAKVVLANNKMEEQDLKESEDGSYVYFYYEKEMSGNNYSYMSAIKKGEDAFWLINFAVLEKDQEEYRDIFHNWAKSIEV